MFTIKLFQVIPSEKTSEENRKKGEYIQILADKALEHKADSDTKCICCPSNGFHRSGKETGKTRDENQNRDHSEYVTVGIHFNPKKCLGM